MKKWYLHNLNTNVEFRRKGIDYTFGDEVNYGGILIKEVRGLFGEKLLHTQSKFIYELVNVLNPIEVSKYNSIVFLKMIEEEEKLRFEKNKNLT